MRSGNFVYDRRMFHTIFRTTWQHIARTRYVSCLIIGGFALIFLMILVGISLTGALRDQRVLLVQKFTYPLFMSEGMTAGSPRVQDFIQSLASTGISGNIDYVTKEEALDKEVQKNPGILSALNGENPLPDVIMIPLY